MIDDESGVSEVSDNKEHTCHLEIPVNRIDITCEQLEMQK